MKRETLGILALAALLRLPGLFTDLWLDEIWALGNVENLSSVSGILTGIHHDSNHWLVSLWMYVVGAEARFALYRLPSFLAGVAAVPLSGELARLSGSPRTLTMLLVAVSFPLGFYSSEARGYSLAVLLSFLSVVCFVRWLEGRGRRFLYAFWISTTLGLLSHLTFLIVVAALAVYGAFPVGRGAVSFRRLLAPMTVPAAALAALFFLDLRHLEIGGGPRVPPEHLLAQTASLAVGGPIELPRAWPFAIAAVLALGAELARRLRQFWSERERSAPRSLTWSFYVAVLGIPLWLALVLDPPFLFPRYFLVSIGFVPVLLASLVRASPRPAAALILVFLLGANALSWARFAAEGRGQYRQALRDMLAESSSPTVAIASDQDFRTEKVAAFYRKRLGMQGSRLRYVRRQDRTDSEADFWIATSAAKRRGFQLVRVYPSSPLSGATWYVYRRAP